MIPPLPTAAPRPGDRQVSAAFLQELAKQLATLMRLSGDGVSLDAGGLQVTDTTPPPDWFIAKITAEDAGAYAWTEQRPANTASGYEDRPEGRTGTTTVDPVRELNDAEGIAEGTLVLMFPGWHTAPTTSRIDRGWRFVHSATEVAEAEDAYHLYYEIPIDSGISTDDGAAVIMTGMAIDSAGTWVCSAHFDLRSDNHVDGYRPWRWAAQFTSDDYTNIVDGPTGLTNASRVNGYLGSSSTTAAEGGFAIAGQVTVPYHVFAVVVTTGPCDLNLLIDPVGGSGLDVYPEELIAITGWRQVVLTKLSNGGPPGPQGPQGEPGLSGTLEDGNTAIIGDDGILVNNGGTLGVIPGVPVGLGGTGQSTLPAGQLLAGNDTSPIDSVGDTRVSGESLELKLGSDSWVAFSEDSF